MLKLYVTTDGDNVINKTLQFKKEYPIKFKEQTSITSPIIALQVGNELNILDCNYCYVSEFNRYYFIQDIQVVNKNMYRLTLDCDVLESFKDDILNSYVKINRKLDDGDYTQINNIIDLRKENELYHSDVTLNSEKTLILTTMGGG